MLNNKSNIAVIGAGKIAYSLIHYLVKSNYKISCIISKNINSAKKLSIKYSIKNYSDDLSILSGRNKFFILSVPDDQIKKTAIKLSKLNLDFKNSLFIHLSGSQNSSSLFSLKKKGAKTASFHIMQTFPSKKIIKLNKNYAAIETENKEAEKFLFQLALKINLIPFLLSKDEKINYHLAGVFASNFLTSNLFMAHEIFDENKINFIDLITPILNSTLKNIKSLGIQKSLSGPVERGDIETIKKHIPSLKNKKFYNNGKNIFLKNYIFQSFAALEIVRKKGNFSENHLKIEKYLLSQLKN